MSELAAFEAIPFDDDADQVRTWKGLAISAIMDLRHYADDSGPERRMVSAEAYEADAVRLHACAPTALCRNELAEAIHRGRFKDREPTPFGSDRLDREYAFRIADSVIAATKSAPVFKAPQNSAESDPAVTPGWPGADTGPNDETLAEWAKWLDWDTGLSVADEVTQLRFLYHRFIAPAVIANVAPPAPSAALDRDDEIYYEGYEQARSDICAANAQGTPGGAITPAEPTQSPQYIIEGVILRRLHEKRIEGYTLEMSKEIADALAAGQQSAATTGERCDDCPPVGYPTDKTRCTPCDRRKMSNDKLDQMADILGEIEGLTTSLRSGGPDPIDLQELSDSLSRACELATDAGNLISSLVSPEPSPSTATNAEPVAVTGSESCTCHFVGDGKHHVLGCVFAIPPSSGNADAVPQQIAKLLWQRFHTTLDVMNCQGFEKFLPLANEIAALSSAPVAGKWQEALKQITSVCADNAGDECDQKLALRFVANVAREALANPRHDRGSPLVEITRGQTTPCGECHLRPGETRDICDAKEPS